MAQIHYRGWIIEPDFVYANADGTPNGRCDFKYYREGDEQAWMTHYITLEDVKEEIDERIIESQPLHIVRTNFGMREYHFPWLTDAMGFQKLWGGDLLPHGQPILNP